MEVTMAKKVEKEAHFIRLDTDLNQDLIAFVEYLNKEKRRKDRDQRDLKISDVFEIALKKYMMESGYLEVREKYNPEGFKKSLEPI
jgi:hypothetical protein